MPITIVPNFAHTQAEQSGQVDVWLDDEADLAGLENRFAPGSVAVIIKLGLPVYMLNNAHQWVKVKEEA